VNRFDDEDETP
jgi:hypothetical protein